MRKRLKPIFTGACALAASPAWAQAPQPQPMTIPAIRTEQSTVTPAPPAPPMAEWNAFADGIRDLWPRLYARLPERLRDDPQVRLEAARLLLSALTQQTIEALAADGDHPVFLPHIGFALNVGQPNADTTYRAARITPGGLYRLRGKAGSLPISRIGQFGLTPDQTGGGVAALGYLDLKTLKVDAQGRFDVLAGPTRPAGYTGDWWQLDARTAMLMIRQMSSDWAKETDPALSIERVDAPVQNPRRSAEDLAHRLTDVPRRTANMAGFLVDHVEKLRTAGHINTLTEFDVSNGGALQGQFYYEGAYELKPDEALVIETRVPAKCLYYSTIVTNEIYETTNWYDNQSSLNNAQSHVDKDGILRIVVSARDPGVPNWLDTAGYPQGAVQGRWTNCDSQPVPTVTRMPLAKVRSALPANTPVVTPAEREQQIRDRRAAAQQRPLW